METRENVVEYMCKLMDMELTHFLGREHYEHDQGEVNHCNDFYGRNFTLKEIGEVQGEVPRDRRGQFKTQIIPEVNDMKMSFGKCCQMFGELYKIVFGLFYLARGRVDFFKNHQHYRRFK